MTHKTLGEGQPSMKQAWRKLGKLKLLIAFVALYKLLVSAVVLLPWSSALEASALSRLPSADRALFMPGGPFLVEWLRLEAPQLIAALKASLWLGLFGGVFLLFPVALLLAALSDDEPSFAKHSQRAFVAMPRFVLLFGSTTLVQSLYMMMLVLLWGMLSSGLAPAAQTWLLSASIAAAIAGWLLSNIIQDLARAAVVGQRLATAAALMRAVRVFLQHPAKVLGHYAVPTTAALIVVPCSMALTDLLIFEASTDPHVGATFLVHQTCFLLLVALRTVWLHSALSLVSSSGPRPVDTRADSGAQDDPNLNPCASYE